MEELTRSCFLTVGLKYSHLCISTNFRFVEMPPIGITISHFRGLSIWVSMPKKKIYQKREGKNSLFNMFPKYCIKEKKTIISSWKFLFLLDQINGLF